MEPRLNHNRSHSLRHCSFCGGISSNPVIKFRCFYISCGIAMLLRRCLRFLVYDIYFCCRDTLTCINVSAGQTFSHWFRPSGVTLWISVAHCTLHFLGWNLSSHCTAASAIRRYMNAAVTRGVIFAGQCATARSGDFRWQSAAENNTVVERRRSTEPPGKA